MPPSHLFSNGKKKVSLKVGVFSVSLKVLIFTRLQYTHTRAHTHTVLFSPVQSVPVLYTQMSKEENI